MPTSVPPGDNNYYDAPPTGFFRTSAATRTIVAKTHPATSAAIIDRCSTSMTMTRCCAYEHHACGTFLIEEVSLDRRHPRTNLLRKFLFRKRRAFEQGRFLNAKRDIKEGNDIVRTNYEIFRSVPHIDSQSRESAKFACHFRNDNQKLAYWIKLMKRYVAIFHTRQMT